MSKTIAPQEMMMLNDNPVIRTVCSPQFITGDMVKRHVRRANLAVGDTVMVQCFSHDREHLIAEVEYRVTARVTSIKVVEKPDFSTHQSEETGYEVRQWSDWCYVDEPLPTVSHAQRLDPVASSEVSDDRAIVKWNVGKRAYEVISAGEVVGEYNDKDAALYAASAHGTTAAA